MLGGDRDSLQTPISTISLIDLSTNSCSFLAEELFLNFVGPGKILFSKQTLKPSLKIFKGKGGALMTFSQNCTCSGIFTLLMLLLDDDQQ